MNYIIAFTFIGPFIWIILAGFFHKVLNGGGDVANGDLPLLVILTTIIYSFLALVIIMLLK